MPSTLLDPVNLQGGWFRRLTHGDEAALLAHHRRLSPEDRRTRFLHAVGDAYLAQHARKLREPGYHVIGWFHHGTLRGVAEIAIDAAPGHAAEAAFSVEPEYRNRGIGRSLMRRALRRARLCGAGTLSVHTSADNRPMIRIASAFGARVQLRDGELVGELTPAPASLAEMQFDLIEDRIGLVAAGGELALTLLAAVLSGRSRTA